MGGTHSRFIYMKMSCFYFIVLKGLKNQVQVKMNIVSCPPVTTVLIKRPDLKYQLGFSVQNGIVSRNPGTKCFRTVLLIHHRTRSPRLGLQAPGDCALEQRLYNTRTFPSPSDMQPDARRHRRAGGGPSGAPDYRDQRAKRGGHGAREDRPGSVELCWRG